MQTKIIIFILLSIPFVFPKTFVLAEKQPENSALIQIEGKRLDNRAVVLSKYLSKYNSPLQYHAQDFIDASDIFGLDWKMLPAIAGVESTFGKQIPGGYNAWGWGVYGTQAIYFNSWKDGIFTIAAGLRKNYLNRGLTDPSSINRIYASSPHWGSRVSFFMDDLEKFSNQYLAQAQKRSQVGIVPTVAADSGQLAL